MLESSNSLTVQEKGRSNAAQLMDVRGVASYLKLDRQTIYNWLHQQKISGIKVGGVWRFDRRMIDAWLQSRTVGHSVERTSCEQP